MIMFVYDVLIFFLQHVLPPVLLYSYLSVELSFIKEKKELSHDDLHFILCIFMLYSFHQVLITAFHSLNYYNVIIKQ